MTALSPSPEGATTDYTSPPWILADSCVAASTQQQWLAATTMATLPPQLRSHPRTKSENGGTISPHTAAAYLQLFERSRMHWDAWSDG